jgi:hypothetical protein
MYFIRYFIVRICLSLRCAHMFRISDQILELLVWLGNTLWSCVLSVCLSCNGNGHLRAVVDLFRWVKPAYSLGMRLKGRPAIGLHVLKAVFLRVYAEAPRYCYCTHIIMKRLNVSFSLDLWRWWFLVYMFISNLWQVVNILLGFLRFAEISADKFWESTAIWPRMAPLGIFSSLSFIVKHSTPHFSCLTGLLSWLSAINRRHQPTAKIYIDIVLYFNSMGAGSNWSLFSCTGRKFKGFLILFVWFR